MSKAANTIHIRKGLDLPLRGEAEPRITDARYIARYAVKPTDFVGLVPRLNVQEGDTVTVGDALFCDKNDERIRFTSPVNGHVKAIVRGEKRKLLAVVVEEDPERKDSLAIDPTNVKEAMLQTGLWTMLRQRPFGTIANPDDKPKAIFVSAFDSAPLAPDYDFILQGKENWFKEGLNALSLLTNGKVHVSFRPDQKLLKHLSPFPSHLSPFTFTGPHPAGNIGTQIAHIDPINKGEVVWTMNPQDVAALGEMLSTGWYRPEKTVAMAGPDIKNPHYYRIKNGACVENLVAGQIPNPNYPKVSDGAKPASYRIISGNVLSGTQLEDDGFVSAYDSLLTLLPEGDHYEFMGWLMPGFRKFSFSRTFMSGFMPKSTFKPLGVELPRLEGFWKFDTNTHGEERPLVFTGNFERVFPFDIYPTQLIKACIVGDVELMENLGIYEVEPEDFALCEFIDTSKTDIQHILREALEKIRKELMNP